MFKFMKRIKQEQKQRVLSKQHRQDVWSCTDFMKGLKSGKTSVGSLLFEGDDREEKLIRKLCRYVGVDFICKRQVLCSTPDCSNKFYVTHYDIRYQND